MGRCALSMATSTSTLVKISEIAAELWWFSFFQNGGRPPSWILLQVKNGVTAGCGLADCPCLPPCQIWWQYLKWRPSYCNFPFFKIAAGCHLGFGPTDLQDHSWRRLVGLKCPVKFRIDLTYSKILKIQLFLRLAWNCLTTTTFGGFYEVLIPWTIFFLIETLKRHILGWSRVVWGIDRENPSTRFCCRRRQEKNKKA